MDFENLRKLVETLVNCVCAAVSFSDPSDTVLFRHVQE